MPQTPEFSVITVGGTTTYCIKLPQTDEGMDMLREIGRMFRHRGETDTAERIERCAVSYATSVRPAAKGKLTSKARKPRVPGSPEKE